MKQIISILFVAFFLVLTGCQSNKTAINIQNSTADVNLLPTVDSENLINSTTNNHSSDGYTPYPMGENTVSEYNPYPMNDDNTNATGTTNMGQPGNSSQKSSYVFKTSEPKTATLHGVLLVTDPILALPDANDGLFLVPLSNNEGIVTIPPFTVGEVPQADVDEITGEFNFTNIKPGRYVIVVLTSSGTQIPAKFSGEGGFAIIEVKDSDLDKTMELDNLQL